MGSGEVLRGFEPDNDIPIGPDILGRGIQQQIIPNRRSGKLRLAFHPLPCPSPLLPFSPDPLRGCPALLPCPTPRPVLDTHMHRPVTNHRQTVSAGKAVLAAAVERRQMLRVAEDDPLFLPAFQRKDAHLEGAAVDPFQQGWVLHAGDNRLEDLAGVLPFGHAALPCSRPLTYIASRESEASGGSGK